MLDLVFNAAVVVLVAAVAAHSVILHLRLHRLGRALAEAGRVLPTLDESVGRMAEITSGFAERLQADLRTVDGRVVLAQRLGKELADVNQAAEEAAAQLERLLRHHRREGARAASIPRELVEPKGIAERAGLALAAVATDESAGPSRDKPVKRNPRAEAR
jgi:hypothetical protein